MTGRLPLLHEGTTQGDPLAMAMYALAVKPLIGKLKSDAPNMKQVWYADDATGANSCDDLRMFCRHMVLDMDIIQMPQKHTL